MTNYRKKLEGRVVSQKFLDPWKLVNKAFPNNPMAKAEKRIKNQNKKKGAR